MKEKQVELFNDDFKYTLTDIPRLKFLEFEEGEVQRKNNEIEMEGSDGALVGASNFAPFELKLMFSYLGDNMNEYKLAKEKVRQIINQRDPYYVWHSEMPGKKYAVVPSGQSIEDLTATFGTFEITFSVYKGYSESYKDTSDFDFSDESFQFQQGIIGDEAIQYNHNTRYFKIYNGSSDTINPLLRHKLNIKINVVAPNGFELCNLTTGDIFEYKKALKKRTEISILGVHPYIDNKRVGKDTNYDFITLAPGWNEILIRGESLTDNPEIEFVFNYIYR